MAASIAKPWKNSLDDIDIGQLKSVRVKIHRPDIPQPEDPEPIMRGLDAFWIKSLVIHFRSDEGSSPIFDRDDIKVNQYLLEERTVHLSTKRSKSKYRRRSCSSSDTSSSSEEQRRWYRRDSKTKKYRSVSRSPSQSRSRSKSSSPKRSRNKFRSSSGEQKRIPGVYIPTKEEQEEARERARRRRELLGLPLKNPIDSKDKAGPSGEKNRKPSERRRSSSYSPHRRRRKSSGSESDDNRRYDRRRRYRNDTIVTYEKTGPPYWDENYWGLPPGPMPSHATFVSSNFFPYPLRPMARGMPLYPRMPMMMHPPMGMRPPLRLPVYNRPYRPPPIRPPLAETVTSEPRNGDKGKDQSNEKDDASKNL